MRALPLAASLALLVVAPRTAEAGVFLGAELDGAAGIDLPPGAHFGVGFLGVLAYRIGIGPIFLQPEGAAGYTVFPADATPLHVARVLGGVRVGLNAMVQPTLFGHAGVGWFGGGPNGPALDAGVALTFKLVPVFLFGAQAAYNVVPVLAQSSATKWVSFGAQVGVEL